MPCIAVFEKELPIDCILQVVKQVKDGDKLANILITSGQIIGQLGAVLGGATDTERPFGEIAEQPESVEDCCSTLEKLCEVQQGLVDKYLVKYMLETLLKLLMKELSK